MKLQCLILATYLVGLPTLMAGNAEQCWKTLCGNRFVLVDLPGKPEQLTPANPQMVQLSDDHDRTFFQEYTVYAARVEHFIVVALFDSGGRLLDYSMRRPPDGFAQFSLKAGKKKNQAEVLFRFEDEDRPDESWSLRFQRPELKW